MSIVPISEIREVTAITEVERQRICDFLQGAVYCWAKNRVSEWFALRDLMGGSNFFWNKTPLIILWDKHKMTGLNDDEALIAAAKDAGWLLKRVVANDRRIFETKKDGLVRKYRWSGDDGNISD